jgi:hypothetical protein
MTSAVGDSHLPESLSGPCEWFPIQLPRTQQSQSHKVRYHELNTHKVTNQGKLSKTSEALEQESIEKKKQIERAADVQVQIDNLTSKLQTLETKSSKLQDDLQKKTGEWNHCGRSSSGSKENQEIWRTNLTNCQMNSKRR